MTRGSKSEFPPARPDVRCQIRPPTHNCPQITQMNADQIAEERYQPVVPCEAPSGEPSGTESEPGAGSNLAAKYNKKKNLC